MYMTLKKSLINVICSGVGINLTVARSRVSNTLPTPQYPTHLYTPEYRCATRYGNQTVQCPHSSSLDAIIALPSFLVNSVNVL